MGRGSKVTMGGRGGGGEANHRDYFGLDDGRQGDQLQVEGEVGLCEAPFS